IPGTTWTHGRRGAVIGASAAVVCLGAALAACGGGGRGEGYVATGVAGGAPQASATAAAPTGGVTLVPLDGRSQKRDSPAPGSSSGDVPETAVPTSPDPAPSIGGTKPGRTTPDSPSPTATPSRTAPAGPAALTWSDPVREATGKRW